MGFSCRVPDDDILPRPPLSVSQRITTSGCGTQLGHRLLSCDQTLLSRFHETLRQREGPSKMGLQIPVHPEHEAAVGSIVRQVRHFYENKVSYRVYHGSTNSTRTSPYRHDNIVDISGLKRVLEIRVEGEFL